MNPSYPPDPSAPFDYQGWAENKLQGLKADGAYRYFLGMEKSAEFFPQFRFSDHTGRVKTAINWCGNDYLSMSTHSEVMEVFHKNIMDAGAGSGGTRNIAGTTQLHQELEKELASWHGKEAALLFNGAYQANQTAMSTLGRLLPTLVFISDEENHASLIEGMRAVPNKKYIFRHNDLNHLEEILDSIPSSVPRLLVFESVYSISGTVAPVNEMVALAKKYQTLTYIDEVHAVGLYGPEGSGLSEELGARAHIDFINGTLSKAVGVFGGYIAASATWVDLIRSFGPGFIFTTSLPPAVCAAATASIRHIRNHPELRMAFFANVHLLRTHLDHHAIPYSGIPSHITHIRIGLEDPCRQLSEKLLISFGQYLQPINFPTVPKGEACLRLTITPRHTEEHILQLAAALDQVLERTIVLTGRGSKLSRLQIDITRQKIQSAFPRLTVEIKYKDSLGDQLPGVPLDTQEGVDFFTRVFAEELQAGRADLAVHSLKDMSGDHFFGSNRFAVIDRDEIRDMAIFNRDIEERLRKGLPIRIGTCSFRRQLMAEQFLSKALPRTGAEIKIQCLPIRGNVDTRLSKLRTGEYDGVILAAAGINRMLKDEGTRAGMQGLLQDKKMMLLPITECVPAPCQGAIVVEANPENEIARQVLQRIIDPVVHADCSNEKYTARQYGSGCLQRFGVTTVGFDNKKWIYAAGIDEQSRPFKDWYGVRLPSIPLISSTILSSDELGFNTIRKPVIFQTGLPVSPVYFIAHRYALDGFPELQALGHGRIWVAGTSTWYSLAEKGLWVEGCADSFGLESLKSLFASPTVAIRQEEILILTNTESAKRWADQGWQARGTYETRYESSLIDKYKLRTARMIFWNCFAHFDTVKELAGKELTHACLPGRTAELLKQSGIHPMLFPTLDSFKQWKKNYIQSIIAA